MLDIDIDIDDIDDIDPVRWRGFAAVRERLRSLRPIVADGTNLVALGERERVVLSGLTTGQTLAEISARLMVSHNTIKKQTVALYRKLGVHDRRSAVDAARRLGLLEET